MDFNKIFANNEKWVSEKLALTPEYFTNLSKGQNPEFFATNAKKTWPVSQAVSALEITLSATLKK